MDCCKKNQKNDILLNKCWNILGLKKWIKFQKKEKIIKIKANLDFILPKPNNYEKENIYNAYYLIQIKLF